MKQQKLKISYYVSAGVGLCSLLIATFFDTAPEGTHNLGLLQTQMLWAQFAAVALIVAAVLFVGNHIGEKLDRDV